jgi:hypothetical protein
LLSEAYVKLLGADCQPLFGIFPSTVLFPLAMFPLNNSFPFQKLPTPKKPEVKPQKPKAKTPLPPSGVFYSSKQGGAKGRGVTL